MALNIKDPDAESLANELATLAGETKTSAVREALRERLERLRLRGGTGEPRRRSDRRDDLEAFLETEIWPQIPPDVLGKPIPKSERESILGIGREGH